MTRLVATERQALATLVIALAVAGSAPAAHHSEALYHHAVTVLKNAKVVEFVWANPHVILTFEVRDERGNVTPWNAETGSPTGLTRAGWNRNSIRPDDVVTVEVNAAKNGSAVGRLVRVIFPDGKELLDTQLRKPAGQ